VRYGLSLATKDLDMVGHTDMPELQKKALELFGKDTANAQQWGLYLESIPPGLPRSREATGPYPSIYLDPGRCCSQSNWSRMIWPSPN
jgi:hypothetical protein